MVSSFCGRSRVDMIIFFFQAEDGIRDYKVTGVQTCALPISVGRVIERINPILQGWVNYFRVGHSARCFAMIQDWVEKKIRRHLMRARKGKGLDRKSVV